MRANLSALGAGVWAARAFLVMSLLFAPRAHAQYAAPVFVQTPVFVQVNAGGQAFTVLTPHTRQVPAQKITECAAACSFWIYPGTYDVRLHGQDHDTTATLRVRGPASYDFVPESSGPRTAGLVLGIVGPVVTVVGALMVVAGAYNSCDDAAPNPPPCKTPPISYYGAATFLAGAGMTSVGWAMFIYNRPHFVLSNANAAPWQPASARLGLVPMPRGGLGFGATVTF